MNAPLRCMRARSGRIGSLALLGAISPTAPLAPGARLTQEEIAQQLAVSRQPVLQAAPNEAGWFVLDAPGRWR